jgi:hypothetical protein
MMEQKESTVNSRLGWLAAAFHLPGHGSLTLPVKFLSTPAVIKDFIDLVMLSTTTKRNGLSHLLVAMSWFTN